MYIIDEEETLLSFSLTFCVLLCIFCFLRSSTTTTIIIITIFQTPKQSGIQKKGTNRVILALINSNDDSTV